jgi:hypothetical protein
MFAPRGRRAVWQGAFWASAVFVVAFGQIVSVTSAKAQWSENASPRAMVARTATGVDASAEPTKRTGPRASDPAQGGNPLWSLPLSSLPFTRERPIFSPSRRPPPPPVVAAPYVPPAKPPEPPPKLAEPDHPSLTLLGTLAGDSQGVGIFVNEADKTTLRLRTGEDHEGWVLRSIHGGEATFEKGDRTATLALPQSGSAVQINASAVALGNTWRDGDGQLIRAPQKREQKPASPIAVPPRSTWLDGDGQVISAPQRPLSPPAVAPVEVTPPM